MDIFFTTILTHEGHCSIDLYFFVKSDGMVQHVTAKNLNKQGSLMCCFGALHALAAVEGADFDETIDNLKELNKIMKHQVVGSLPSGNAVEKES